MAKKNKSKPTEQPVVETAVVTDVVDEVIETVEEVVETPAVVGVVMNCLKLNVRKEPIITAPVLCEVDVNSELMIDLDKSTDEWVSVTTSAGTEGFCLKKYVSIPQ